jgi:hypothetical protein
MATNEDGRVGRGLVLDVYRHASGSYGDCTRGGITGRHDTVTVVGVVTYREGSRDKPDVGPVPRDARHRLPTDDAPPVWLVIRPDGDRYLTPGDAATGLPDARGGWMDGGNFAASPDSRWTDVVGHIVAVRVHDRREW